MKNDLHTRCLISLGLTLLGIGITWLGATMSQILMWVGIAVLAAGGILSWTVRCPNCGYWLMRKGHLFLPRFCPNCGHKIDESESE